MTTKRQLAIVVLAFVGLAAPGSALAQQPRQAQVMPYKQQQAKTDPRVRAKSSRPIYERRDTWYEFLLRQFNPTNFDYGAWMEERRQVFLNESVRNPYFKYSAGATIALLLMAVICAKQWIDHRRAMWITAEMMADLYNHDRYSRDVAEKAIQKYNQHIERCNRAIEAATQGTAMPAADPGTEALNAELRRVTEERDRYAQERDRAKLELETNSKTLAQMSLRLDGISAKPGANGDAGQSPDLRTGDPAVVKHINNLQEQLYAERQKNQRLKGA